MKMATVPTLICVLRIALTVPIVILLVEGRYGQTLVLFAIAAVSDVLDGYLAKTFGWTSELGKVLDPVADKLLLVSVFITLAWIGLVPRQNSSGGKERLGGISKQGDRYLRKLLVVGAAAVLRHARTHPDKHPWLIQLLARRPAKVAIVALANKMARIAWAVLNRGETYRAPVLAAGEVKGSAMGA